MLNAIKKICNYSMIWNDFRRIRLRLKPLKYISFKMWKKNVNVNSTWFGSYAFEFKWNIKWNKK